MIFENGIFLLLLGFIALLFFKSVFLKLVLVIYWYPLITMYLFCIEYPLGGSIDYLGRSVYESHCREAFGYAVIGYFTFVAVIWNLRNRLFQFKRIEFNERTRSFIAIILVVVSVLAYPKSFGIGNERWNLIAGPWLVISIALNAILIISFQKIKSLSSILQIILSFVLLIGGERVNTLVVFLLFFMLFGSQNLSIVKEKKIGVIFMIGAALMIVLGIGAHYWRNGEELSMLLLYKNIISSATVGDITHIYFSSFSYLTEFGVNLKPVLNEIGSLFYLPKLGGTGKSITYNFTEILREYVHNAGGGLFYTEGVLIFGKIGAVIYSFLYGCVTRFLFINKQDNNTIALISIIFFILQFRVQWYGLMYIYSPIWFSIIAIKFFDLIRKREEIIEIIEE